MPTNGGQLLLILASTDTQSVAQLTAASGLSPTDLLRELTRLVEQGFIIVGTPDGAVTLYQLNPKGTRTETAASQPRVLLIEDDPAVRELMTTVLEDAGYALILAKVPADAASLLGAVAFDLVITDSFSGSPDAALTSTSEVMGAAVGTPVALFTAHQMELDATLAAGFGDLLAKPFDLDTLERQVHALLPEPPDGRRGDA